MEAIRLVTGNQLNNGDRYTLTVTEGQIFAFLWMKAMCDRRVTWNGYIALYRPYHPNRNKQNYVYEHRLVAEEQLGRYLKDTEMVHHINKKRGDNRPQNLMVFVDRDSHNKFEYGIEVSKDKIVFDGRKLPNIC